MDYPQILAPVLNFLQCPTPQAWIDKARDPANLPLLLTDHMVCELKAAQTALLLWNTAGRPEPAEAPAFADVADPDTAKAAQWCVEQGLMKRRLNGKFAPGSSIPAYQVLNAYRKLAGG
mgnify:CR=1 FL=1